MMIKTNHPYHLVDQSPWPIIISFMIPILMLNLSLWMITFSSMMYFFISILLMMMTSFKWWKDVKREATYQGMHTIQVMTSMKLGMTLFITSEVFFFLCFFWGFFHSSLSPTHEIGMMWPPTSISSFNPLEIPLLNTALLLSSGATITWSHHSLMNNHLNNSLLMMSSTALLGMIFTLFQGIEYMQSPFTMADSIYGSCFFMSTGFHGIHVLVGTTFLLAQLSRMAAWDMSSNHHLGFEMSAWYWHFVDVVWLFLYLNIYWWGS